MGRKADDFANSVFGGFLCWATGIYSSFWLARLAWRRITADAGFFGHVLGLLVWAVVFVICLLVFFFTWLPFANRSDFRKKTDSALKALETSLENEGRELSAAQSRAKKRIDVVRAELKLLN